MTARLLPLPDDPLIAGIFGDWERGVYAIYPFPRSMWLRDLEAALRLFYPVATSRDRSLTARHYAPFPLRDGHDVP